MVSWEYYSRRRNISLKDFLKKRNIETYEQYCLELNSLGIVPMLKENFELHVPKIEPKPEPKPIRKKRKYTRRKKQ